MSDKEEHFLRTHIPKIKGLLIVNYEDLIRSLRTCWSSIFDHDNYLYPTFCTHGKKENSAGRLKRLASVWGKLNDYERGYLFHTLKTETQASDTAIRDFLTSFTDAVETVPQLLEKDAELIEKISGKPDHTRVAILADLYRLHCGREPAYTEGGPFSRFAVTILQAKLPFLKTDEGQPFRRALESLDDPLHEKVSRQKRHGVSFLFLPAAITHSEHLACCGLDVFED